MKYVDATLLLKLIGHIQNSEKDLVNSRMNSTFSLKNQWHGTPFDIGVPQYLNYSNFSSETSPAGGAKKSSNCDELKILVEPTVSIPHTLSKKLNSGLKNIYRQSADTTIRRHDHLPIKKTLRPS